uniref:Uncharacterized protein n=1 Tax=Pan paniscus TaxID=9597 RepID=A0A2R9APY0_PANPA
MKTDSVNSAPTVGPGGSAQTKALPLPEVELQAVQVVATCPLLDFFGEKAGLGRQPRTPSGQIRDAGRALQAKQALKLPFSIIQSFGCLSAGIWSAALNGDLGRVKHLIQKAEDPSQPDSAGYTALHYASRNGHYAVCQFLLESGAKCDAQTHGGATALHRASYCGHTEIARLLLSHGSNPRVVDDDGMTSLHKAAERGHGDICSLLLQHSPALKAIRDRKARLACDLLPCNSDLRDLLSS